MIKAICYLLSVTILLTIPEGDSLDCYVCESSNNSTCKDYGPHLMKDLCSLGENACLSFGIKNKYNEDRPYTYVRRCAVDDTICNKVKALYGKNVIQCKTCVMKECNKDSIQ